MEFAVPDPGQGRFYTAIALCTVSDGTAASAQSYGYASDIQPNQEVVDRAVSEAVERSVVTLLNHRDSAKNIGSTMGCAVHIRPNAAMQSASDELRINLECISRFHQRRLGQRVDLTPDQVPTVPASTRVMAWSDSDLGFVCTALFDLTAAPRLGMSARSQQGKSFNRTVELSVTECLQPRAWLKHHMSAPARRAMTGGRTPDERAQFWCSANKDTTNSIVSQLDTELSVGSVRTFAQSVTHELIIKGDTDRDLYFARVEDESIGTRALTIEFEHSLFWGNCTGSFVPHPII
ncbi:hypothetical protein [Mycolicibacterium llatzerense]|uniref:hypothetical protein n=1 Tax=Mycolicibacterium llatzerense TaxID=280871 RepID=UPI0021B6C0BF|nr:hypothetical protein [Mycolicibacterium llatzerense]